MKFRMAGTVGKSASRFFRWLNAAPQAARSIEVFESAYKGSPDRSPPQTGSFPCRVANEFKKMDSLWGMVTKKAKNACRWNHLNNGAR